jgi:uncharacterized phage-associated protein
MTASARDIAAALRERLPNAGVKKVHKLLYYAQGHHLAWFGQPLFEEEIHAYDMGPVVKTLWVREKHYAPDDTLPAVPLDEAELNTVGYVVSRYGNLSADQLERLTHSESPWLRANLSRRPGGSVLIDAAWIREHFVTEGGPDAGDDDALPLDSAKVSAWLEGAAERYEARYGGTPPGTVDEYDQLVARRDELAARRGA